MTPKQCCIDGGITCCRGNALCGMTIRKISCDLILMCYYYELVYYTVKKSKKSKKNESKRADEHERGVFTYSWRRSWVRDCYRGSSFGLFLRFKLDFVCRSCHEVNSKYSDATFQKLP